MTKEEKKDVVEVNALDLQKVIAENKELKKRLDNVEAGAPKVLKKVKERMIRLRKHEDGYVVGYKLQSDGQGPYEELDHLGRRKLYIDILIKDKKDAVKILFTDFMKLKDEWFKVEKINTETKEEVKGHVAKVAYDGYSRKETGVVVEETVTTDIRTFTINVDGEELTLPEEFVNM